MKTHLIFLYGNDQYSEVVLTGQVDASPLVEVNGRDFVLTASFTHKEGITENLYRPVVAYVDNPTTS